MITLMTAAALAAQAAPVQTPANSPNAMPMSQSGEHKAMACCKDGCQCCKDMAAKHEDQGSHHAEHGNH